MHIYNCSFSSFSRTFFCSISGFTIRIAPPLSAWTRKLHNLTCVAASGWQLTVVLCARRQQISELSDTSVASSQNGFRRRNNSGIIANWVFVVGTSVVSSNWVSVANTDLRFKERYYPVGSSPQGAGSVANTSVASSRSEFSSPPQR